MLRGHTRNRCDTSSSFSIFIVVASSQICPLVFVTEAKAVAKLVNFIEMTKNDTKNYFELF